MHTHAKSPGPHQRGHAQATQAPRSPVRSRADTAEVVPGRLAHDVLGQAGQPLDEPTRSSMEARFGHDFSRVRIHSDHHAARAADSLGARAYTVGPKIVFARDQYAPGTSGGRRLLAHELTHVVQQGRSPADPRVVEPAGSPAEREAQAAASAVVGGGGPVRVAAASRGINRDAGWARRGPIPDAYGVGYNEILKKAGASAEPAVRDLASLETTHLLEPDIQAFWALPASRANAVLALEPHAAGTGCEKWFPKLRALPTGSMTLADPYGGTSSVTAHFVPGRTSRKALIIGGVHNKTEPQGAEVVNRLLKLLTTRAAAGKKPFFTVVLVPDLFAATRYASKSPRWITGGMGLDETGKLEKSRSVEPNRNLPLPGEDLAAARARGAGSATAPELVFKDPAKPSAAPRAAHDTKGAGHGGTSIRMLPETRTLVALIEHLQPERIASVHAHSLKKTVGDAPGIFVDPRGVDPTTGTVTDAKKAAEDDRLATAMVTQGRSKFGTAATGTNDPFIGNAPGTSKASVRYASGAHAEGNSLGMWAPAPVASGAGARPGITTVTMEVPQWTDATKLDKIETLDTELLADIFLEDPTTATPSTGPTKP